MDIFREYDIRGVFNDGLDADFAFRLGQAYVKYLIRHYAHPRAVSVGRDVRLSSDTLAASLIEGIRSCGVNVYDLGVCPTPLQYYSLYHLPMDGGIMVTGSHNPPEYNGFKLSVGKETLHGDSIQQIRKIIEGGEFSCAASRGNLTTYDICAAYVAFMKDHFGHCRESRFTPKVVIDAGNGTGGLVAPQILRHMGCDVTELYCDPDGRFPNHHPDPTVVEYIKDLRETTRALHADLGVGYDGDADRIGVIDSSGEIIWGDRLMVLLGREILRSRRDSLFIGDVKCSQVMFDSLEAAGGSTLMWKTGHSLVKSKMRETGAVLAGEFSGHIFIGDRYFGYDDAIYTTCRVVEIMKQHRKGVRDLLADLPETVATPEIRVDCPDDEKRSVVERVTTRIQTLAASGERKDIRECLTIDGIRVVFHKGWALLRSSNTQPVLVMRVEAEDEDHLGEYRGFMETIVAQERQRRT
jgi:phosphomannomutase/phosphoglucomutase